MRVERRIKKLRKELSWLDWKDYKMIDSGNDFDIVIVDNEYVIRIPKTKEYQAILNDEIEFNNFLQDKIKVSIPNYLYLSELHGFAVYRYIKGSDLTELIGKKGLSELIQQLSNFLKVLHSIEIEKAIKFHVSSNKYLKNSIDGIISESFYLQENLTSREARVLKEEIGWYEIAQKRTQINTKLIHGDLSLENMIWDSDEKRLGVLDFSDRDLFDPALDFSELFELGSDFVKEVISQYGGDHHLFRIAKIYYLIKPLVRIYNSLKTQTKYEFSENQESEIKLLKKRIDKHY